MPELLHVWGQMKRTKACILPFSLFATTANAATIHVQGSTPDPIGKRLLFAIRNNVASSPIHKLVEDEEDAAFRLKVVTLDPSKGDVGTSTIYSVTLTMKDFKQGSVLEYYLTSFVGICGSASISGCADGVIAGADNEIAQLVAAFSKAAKSK